jgi:hypothetical protein
MVAAHGSSMVTDEGSGQMEHGEFLEFDDGTASGILI